MTNIDPLYNLKKKILARFNKEDSGTDGIHFESDVTDLYSCISLDMICEAIDYSNKFVNLSESTVSYIKSIYKIAMENALFKEPDGIYKCDIGLAMGSHNAAIASDFVLATGEHKGFCMLIRQKRMNDILRFNRLRDDLIIKLSEDLAKAKEALQIVFEQYPNGLEFNLTSNVIFSKFLDMRLISEPTKFVDTLTILRKSPCKFDIVNQSSNTNDRYKTSAQNHYLDRISNICNTKVEAKRQLKITKLIMSYKGYKRPVKLVRKTPTRRFVHCKKFVTTLPHDQVTNIHVNIKNLLKKSNYPSDEYYYPTDVPDKKLRQFIFTKQKLVKSIWP
jgi:hypothetical protein